MSEHAGTPSDGAADLSLELREEVERGLEFTNVMLHVLQAQGKEAVTHAQALAELLVGKGIITEEELKESIAQAREALAKAVMPRVRLGWMGDKYEESQSVTIDCAERIPLCQARCCSFKFFLTKQDLDEGVARWDYGNPYWIRLGPDGYCSHCDPATRGCTIYETRPHVCRQYDCRKDKRVWIDFEQRVPAPAPEYGAIGVAMADVQVRVPAQDGDAVHDEPGAPQAEPG